MVLGPTDIITGTLVLKILRPSPIPGAVQSPPLGASASNGADADADAERCGPPTSSEFGFSVAGKRKRSPEFPCVSRFRKRRLIFFLSHHNFFRSADVFLTQTDVFLCLKHLAELVDAGSWDEAIDYLSRFLPSDLPLGVHGRALFHFLRVHKAIEDVLAGAPESRSVTTALDQCFIRHPTKSHAITRLRAIFSSLLCFKRYRAVLDIGRVRHQAKLTIVNLVCKTPELKDHMRPARGPMEPQNVLPIGFGYACFRPRRHVKKRGGRVSASVLGRLYLEKKKMLPSLTSDHHSQGLTRESLIKAKEWLVDLVEKSLEAGKRSEAELTQSASNKGGPVTPVSRTSPATFKVVTNRTLFCKAKEWVVYFTEECLKAWPDVSQDDLPQLFCKDGDPDGTVSHTMPGSLTSLAKKSALASVKKPDALFSQTMLGTLTNAAEDSGMSSVTNAGANKPLSEEYFSSSRKNPRMEPATIRQGFDPKRRRTTLTSQIETGAEDQQAK